MNLRSFPDITAASTSYVRAIVIDVVLHDRYPLLYSTGILSYVSKNLSSIFSFLSHTFFWHWLVSGPDDFPDNNNNKGAQRTLVVCGPLN